ncbi:NAD(P)/FAD-dependent oxidoreductase [Mycolicibacter longobardus]|uniref:Pyridine nucleotide-disulfide oxidoreductase n=1 Tax=Mycolicibacter longobardus TaxID=1108812 RepID=A0A1X1YF51_9MYCO|nr:FAD-dependent oxidoreductase [Mycolicibacter longobardus]MCV7385989.1 FAD-dependent oxidoreductase [Mycolicibacter longobardus]ORW09707.1 pyridine nucleotide-disulfide oxidoreductase [Mycolicibacter longobardus]
MSGVVIVGAGLAAVRTAEQLRRNGYRDPITIVGAEAHAPYDRPPLSKEMLRGEVETVALKPAAFYEDNGITLRLGCPARTVDAAAHTVTLADGEVLGYDQLVIATGLVPQRIPSFGDLDGIFVLRSLDDCVALRHRAAGARRAVVIGAGFIGCEVSASLRNSGVEVVLVEPQATPLASVLGEQVGALITRLHQDEGVDVRTGVRVDSVSGGECIESVTLSDGSVIEADLVVVGIGSRPAADWLAGSDVAVADGVVCDAVGRTSAGDVWAIGDVASWRDETGAQIRVEHWSNVAEQARTLVSAMLGSAAPAQAGVPYFWSDQYDVKIQCLGRPRTGDTVHLVEDDGRRFLAYYERDGVLVGVVGAGIPEKVRSARAKIAAGAAISEVLQPV